MYTENILRNRLNSLIENGLLSYDVFSEGELERFSALMD